jgi:hypothetical protein
VQRLQSNVPRGSLSAIGVTCGEWGRAIMAWCSTRQLISDRGGFPAKAVIGLTHRNIKRTVPYVGARVFKKRVKCGTISMLDCFRRTMVRRYSRRGVVAVLLPSQHTVRWLAESGHCNLALATSEDAARSGPGERATNDEAQGASWVLLFVGLGRPVPNICSRGARRAGVIQGSGASSRLAGGPLLGCQLPCGR